MKQKYWIQITGVAGRWMWSIKSINGKGGAFSNIYLNKTQCYNAASHFAAFANLEVRV